MSKIVKLNFLFKVLKWFGGEDLGASPWNLGFEPWWIRALMYVMCIVYVHWCINVYNKVYKTCMMMVNIFKIFC